MAPWQQALRRASLPLAELLERLQLNATDLPLADTQRTRFRLRVPPAYLQQIRPGDPADPLLRQILPLALEEENVPGYYADPVGDGRAERLPGLLHKYDGRVLLTLTGACAIHCRYCFRRHFPYAASSPTHGRWQSTLDYIRADAGLAEVILSGGDPLSLTDGRLAGLAADLATISHLRRLRIHTRLPVIVPERVTGELLAWLTATRLKPVLVLHVNHPREIGPAAATALRRLRDAGVQLLNQSVLLKGVNDAEEVLIELSETLFGHDVLPYYLHLLDPVAGASHFEVGEQRARALHETMRRRLSGYLVPRLVREMAGAPYKLPVL